MSQGQVLRWIAAVAAVLLVNQPAAAAITPTPSPGDPRIRIAPYVPDEIVLLTGTLGYAITVEFGPGERIETVSIGDSLGWQVTPNRRANLLFLKPIDRAPPTNMTVVTDQRAYSFDLRIRTRTRSDDPAVIYALKFEVPEPVYVASEPPPPPPPPEPPLDANHAYSFEGSGRGLPTRVFDDGVSTYFQFAHTTDYPAIFALDPDNKEAAVNTAERDGFLVVDRMAAAFVLRRGDEVTRIINEGFRQDGSARPALPLHRKK